MDNVHEAVKDGHEARVKPEPDAMREAFDAVRWTRGSRGLLKFCAACGRIKATPEVHAPGRPVGKVVSGEK